MEQADRVNHARAALAAYLGEKGEPFDPQRLTEEELGDLVADLRHLADAEGLSWRRALSLAELHHRVEAEDFSHRAALDRVPGRGR